MYQADEYTVSLLHFDKDSTDECGNTWTTNGNPIIKNDQYVFNNGSMYFDGYSYMELADKIEFKANDFTIDFWYKASQRPSNHPAIICQRTASVTGAWSLTTYNNQHEGSSLNFYFYNGGHNNIGYNGGIAIRDDKWHHIALIRKADTILIFVNGIKEVQEDLPKGFTLVNQPLRLGYDAVNNAYDQCYIDELRISNGIARWTENFEPEKENNSKYLLRITLSEEVEREYPVSKDGLDSFIKWFNAKGNGSGLPYYIFEKFLNRKDYILYDKILTFEITDFNK